MADITQELPFSDASVDMLVSRSVLEHLESMEAFAAESGRILRNGGCFIHLLPYRYAPFAIIKRALPAGVFRGILYSLVPETKGIGGFPAKYRGFYYLATVRVFVGTGFSSRI